MVKTLKIYEIINAYNVLCKLKFASLTNDEVLLMLRTKKAMRPIVKAYQEFEQDAKTSVKPDNFEAIANKMQAQEPLSEDEQKCMQIVEKRLVAMLTQESTKTVEWTQEPMSEELLVKLFTECGLENKDEDYIYFLFE